MKKKIILLSIIFLILDIIIKLLIENNLSLYEKIIIIPSFFNITKTYNTGAAWSILSGSRVFLILIGIVVLVFLSLFMKEFKQSKLCTISFSMLYAGIIGNLIDRLIYGHVIDYLDFYIFGYDYPVFNLADIFIVLGCILLTICIIKKGDKNENKSR